MGSRVGSVAILACLIAAITIAPGIQFGSSPKGAIAGAAVQQASPVPDAITDATMRLPDEIEVVLLGAMELGGLPAEAIAIQLERVNLMPGDTVTARADATELLVVESGDISVATAKESVTLETGGQIVIPAGELYEISAGEAGAATVLRLSLGGANPNDDQPSPIASPLNAQSAVLLISGERIRLDSRRGTLFIARVTLPAGAATGRQIFSGPVGVAVESGTLRVNAAPAPDLVLETGSNLLVPGFTAVDIANDGEEPAVLLVAGVLPPPTGSAIGPMASPSPAADTFATAQAEIDSLQSSVATLATSEAALSGTVTAQQTAIASAETAQASAEAELTRVASEAVAGAATAVATVSSLQNEVAAGESTLATANAELATAESTLTAVSSELAAVQAAAITAAEESAANATAASEASSALQATVVALQTQNAGLTTDQATAQSNATSAASTAAADQAAAEATIAAQATAIAAANATATAESQAAASVIAVGESSLVNADATIEAQSAQIAAANATATAQAEAAASVEAIASADAAAAATAFAEQSIAATAAAATASAENAAVAATVTAQSAFIDSLEGTLATAIAQGVVSEATIVALSTAQAESSSLVVASVNPNFVDVSVQVQPEGVVAGDEAAITAAQEALDTALAPFDGCRAGVVLTFGHGNTIGQGTVLARAMNTVIQERFPEIFAGAAFDAFGDLRPPLGQVDIRIYFFTGCAAAEQATPES